MSDSGRGMSSLPGLECPNRRQNVRNGHAGPKVLRDSPAVGMPGLGYPPPLSTRPPACQHQVPTWWDSNGDRGVRTSFEPAEFPVSLPTFERSAALSNAVRSSGVRGRGQSSNGAVRDHPGGGRHRAPSRKRGLQRRWGVCARSAGTGAVAGPWHSTGRAQGRCGGSPRRGAAGCGGAALLRSPRRRCARVGSGRGRLRQPAARLQRRAAACGGSAPLSHQGALSVRERHVGARAPGVVHPLPTMSASSGGPDTSVLKPPTAVLAARERPDGDAANSAS
jgi:hypothetical protein